MKTIAFALASTAYAGYGQKHAGFGTTGHYENQYAHGGHQDHAHEDHIYGYDSVPADLDLDEGDQTTLMNAIIAEVQNANDDRIAYLQYIRDTRQRRLQEIKEDNDEKIDAPFNYQLRLLREEEDDILQARNNAVRDSNDAYDDMEWRLDQLRDDIVDEQNMEVEKITNALKRAVVDQKNPGKVFHALKIDWLSEIDVDPTDPNGVSNDTDRRDFSIYDGLFDDFHYDIGHGKGTGETRPLPDGPAVDGYDSRRDPRATGPVGDYETDHGARAWAWEMNGSHY